jgi:hypothetical protein
MKGNIFDWIAHAEAVATDIFGPCNEAISQRCEDLRFGGLGLTRPSNPATDVVHQHPWRAYQAIQARRQRQPGED